MNITNQIFESILVFSGFSVIVVSIFLYLKLLDNVKMIDEHIDWATDFILITYIVLLVFFLTCYSFVATSIFIGADLNNINMIGILLLSGSIFIIFSIVVQIRLVKCVYESHMQIMSSLIKTVETRDENLRGHSLHVRAIATLILENLPKLMSKGINNQKFEYACLMHDLGKLGIPEKILNKPSKLTEDEWSLMKEHPKIGIQIIENISGLDEIKSWILYHHERIDGQGYYGVLGSDIPLASKIISIADAYSAIVMNRLYKSPKEHDEAIKIMLENAGTQFDPLLLDIFKNIEKTIVEEKSVFLRENSTAEQVMTE
jgi:HD-GYP domain-containing protein (c-di-GMP phosphodiesterase class II)